MNDDAFQLRDLPPAEPLLPFSTWPWWAWAGMALLTLSLGLLATGLWLRRKPKPPPIPDFEGHAYTRALDRLDRLAGDLPEIATGASLLLREYLASAAHDTALYETHEEFIARSSAMEELPAELRARTATELERLGRLKYTGAAEGDAEALLRSTRHLLETLHQRQAP